jgi:D-glycero-alpha-D-manno-heptose 1-phosphate guanylyltransferase
MQANKALQPVTLAVGYKYQTIVDFIGKNYLGIEVSYSIETEPLGTGGAIKQAISGNNDVFIINGDTFFDVDLQLMYAHHKQKNSDISLALKPMQHFNRYGAVAFNNGRITAFHEKKHVVKGNINGGIYILNKKIFEGINQPTAFSFETDILQVSVNKLYLNGYVSDTYFIDIGIPEDFEKAQHDFKTLF